MNSQQNLKIERFTNDKDIALLLEGCALGDLDFIKNKIHEINLYPKEMDLCIYFAELGFNRSKKTKQCTEKNRQVIDYLNKFKN